MKKFYKRCITIGATLLIAAAFVVPIWYIWTHYCCRLNSQAELMYFTFAVVSGNATLLAVLVALFGKDIESFLFPNECEVKILDGKFKPVIQGNDNPMPIKYEAKLEVRNNGRRLIKDCELQVIKTGYKTNADASYPMQAQIPKNANWINGTSKIDLRKKERNEIVVAEILPPSGDPDNAGVASIQINGTEVPLQEQNHGFWKIECEFKNRDDIIKTFAIEIHWTGDWNNVEGQMNATTSINII